MLKKIRLIKSIRHNRVYTHDLRRKGDKIIVEYRDEQGYEYRKGFINTRFEDAPEFINQ